jgi:subtilase family serine protease
MGQEIKIYDINSENGNVIATVKDGTKLQRIVSDIDYGDFYEISFNNQRAFVQKKHATHSLTLNQKTALIVGAVTLAVIAAVFALIMFIRRSARR